MAAYYSATVAEFLNTPADDLLGRLMQGYSLDAYGELKMAQYDAWREEVAVLAQALEQLRPTSDEWGLALEFTVPRRMGRIDAVLLINDTLAVLEFKRDCVDSAAAIQVEDYALDLLYFHATSRNRRIYPIVVGSDHSRCSDRLPRAIHSDLEATQFVTQSELAPRLRSIAQTASLASNRVDVQSRIEAWCAGEYHPVPTVVEAAVGMFQNMKVDDIARADADPKNLGATIEALRDVVIAAARNKEKVICFVTGVPGAGKTLAGLKLVHDDRTRQETESHLTFLSGNGPLVAVLQTALAKDLKRRKQLRSSTARRDPRTLIQSVYQFKNTTWASTEPPSDHVLVFDEAQRAWDQKTNVRKLRKGSPCPYSEPGLLLSVLDRHHDWAVMVALIGGGQEIHTGEAGLEEWGRTLGTHFPHWKVIASSAALDGGAGAGRRLFAASTPPSLSVVRDDRLHLDNPTRQFRGKAVSLWADAVIDGDSDRAHEVLSLFQDYPIVLTRELSVTKRWLAEQARGSERYGLLASSNAKRLRADGITVPAANDGNVEHWFLNGPGDVRSSFQLEVAATEFQCQGLEVDWAAVCWGGDLVSRLNGGWSLYEFSGTRWQELKSTRVIARNYLLNTYRVLLTRARQGMVLYVPLGSSDDPTRAPAGFDRTAEFLIRCGARRLRQAASQSA